MVTGARGNDDERADDGWRQDLEAAGVPEAEIERALAEREGAARELLYPGEPPGDFEVWTENVPAIELFIKLDTQWRVVAGMAGGTYLGLEYTAVEAVMRICQAKKRAALFADLQVMEAAALKVLNDRLSDRTGD